MEENTVGHSGSQNGFFAPKLGNSAFKWGNCFGFYVTAICYFLKKKHCKQLPYLAAFSTLGSHHQRDVWIKLTVKPLQKQSILIEMTRAWAWNNVCYPRVNCGGCIETLRGPRKNIIVWTSSIFRISKTKVKCMKEY